MGGFVSAGSSKVSALTMSKCLAAYAMRAEYKRVRREAKRKAEKEKAASFGMTVKEAKKIGLI